MTQAFLIVLRLLSLALVGYWGYRLWTGTTSWASRGLSALLIGTLAWQIIGGSL